MARSGHCVHLMCPPIVLASPQPPLGRGDLVDELARAGPDLLPGYAFATGAPAGEVDIAIALGDCEIPIRAARHVRLNASPWSGLLGDETARDVWDGGLWPLIGVCQCADAAEASNSSKRTAPSDFSKNWFKKIIKSEAEGPGGGEAMQIDAEARNRFHVSATLSRLGKERLKALAERQDVPDSALPPLDEKKIPA